jgi:NADH-quinone oxidoreductase subunit E
VTTPEGQPENSVSNGQAANGYLPHEVDWEPVVHEQSPLTPVFDELTRQRTAEIVARYPQSRSALLPLLHLVQHVQGYVSRAGIAFCAEILEITTAEVSAVATFYTMYKREPVGRHLVSVCTNTLCAALGGDAIYAAVSERLGGIAHEQTSADGTATIEHAECLAACDLAPVLTVDYEFFDNQTVDSALEIIDALRRGEKPHPTRGAPLTDFRSVELLLAGFFDDPAVGGLDAVAGPSAADESLRGARLAEERGWTAPPVPDRETERSGARPGNEGAHA